MKKEKGIISKEKKRYGRVINKIIIILFDRYKKNYLSYFELLNIQIKENEY